jgi:hypothetical protein
MFANYKYFNRFLFSSLALQTNNQHCITMSKALVRELDLKMQQVREYGLIAHGYHNENFQYPVHVRRSHDGEKIARPTRIVSNSDNHQKKNYISDSTILTPSSHENRTKIKQKDLHNRQLSYDERHTTLIVPPNKTINDINPSLNCDRSYIHRKSSLSLTNSSPILCSIRPHSIAGISLSTTDDQQEINSLSNSSQSLLINQSSPAKTLTQRFFSKLFHQSSKS